MCQATITAAEGHSRGHTSRHVCIAMQCSDIQETLATEVRKTALNILTLLTFDCLIVRWTKMHPADSAAAKTVQLRLRSPRITLTKLRRDAHGLTPLRINPQQKEA